MRRVIAASAVVLALTGFGAGTAVAKDGDVIREGGCTGATDWKLKLSPENGRIEAEFEVDQNVNGQAWNTKLKRNGVVVAHKVKTTKPPSGSFEFRRVLDNGPGAEIVVGRARSLSSGELCRGRATFSA